MAATSTVYLMTAFHQYVASLGDLISPPKNDSISDPKICDLGCGPNKFPKSFGVDSFNFKGVDKIINLNDQIWDLPDESFDVIIAHQVLEHVEDPLVFFKNLHRITRSRGLAIIAVPHFSSANSYKDPTHKRHLSALWCELLTKENYLTQMVGQFEVVNNQLTFGKGLKDSLARQYIRFYGLEKFERRMTYILPGIDVYTTLRVLKP